MVSLKKITGRGFREVTEIVHRAGMGPRFFRARTGPGRTKQAAGKFPSTFQEPGNF